MVEPKKNVGEVWGGCLVSCWPSVKIFDKSNLQLFNLVDIHVEIYKRLHGFSVNSLHLCS